MKRAIITGATGAIGTALINELTDNNIEVLAICRKTSERNKNIPKNPLVTVMHCDMHELNVLQNNTGKNWDIFYHLAWAGTTGQARDDMYMQNENVKYALDAVGVAKRFGCSTFVGVGSQAEYGRVSGIMKPDTPAFPETGYGIAKLCAGQMTREYATKIGMKHIWIRVLSVYGPNDSMQSLVMSTIQKFKRGENPKFTKGDQIWDYLYSEDAARAFRLIGEKGRDRKVYVLGSGESRPLREYIKIIRDVVAPKQKITFGNVPYSKKQVMNLQSDGEILKKDIGFVPVVDFRTGIANIVEWRKK